jgi:hypothetical protein
MRDAPYPEEQVIASTIGIESLRKHRSRCNHNCLVDVRTEGFRQICERPIYLPNQFPSGRPPRTLADNVGPVKRVFADRCGRGQFMPPAGPTVAEMPDLHEARVRHAQDIGTLRQTRCI